MRKNTALILALFLIINFVSAQSYDNYFAEWELDFKEGSTQYLFGNNVKLRDAPNLKSNLVELVKIEQEVKILQKTEATDIFKGIAHPWYKVQVGEKVGYILGALIAHHKISDPSKTVDFYFHINPQYEEKEFSLDIKVYQKNELLQSVNFNPTGRQFSFRVTNNRGFHDISSIIMVDYISEACGVEGGISYFFWDDEDLTHIANLSEIGDGGILHYDEQFVFPDENENMYDGEAVILYKQESGESIDEETQWYYTKSQSRILKWDNKKKEIIPKNFQVQPEDQN